MLVRVDAITRAVSPTLAACELTYLAREPIDIARASAQHADYERLLVAAGARIVRVPAAPELPDAVFVEDTAIVLDEIAVMTRPGAPVRRLETPAVAAVLAAYRPLAFLTSPATLDGGDVLRIGRTLYVGRSDRTNQAGIDQLTVLVTPLDYQVVPTEFSGCLHLKSAVTQAADDLVLLNPAWVSRAAFPGVDALAVDAREPHAANALRIAGKVVYPAQFPRTVECLLRRGLDVVTVECSELAKAEGAVTCCSLLVEVAPA